MNNMTNNQDSKFQSYIKRAWVIYALIIIALIVVLVLFVAQDNEERFFFTIMPAAAAYVLRPTTTGTSATSFSSSLAFLNPQRMNELALPNNSHNNGRS
jgi:hypothetical protein